MTRWLAYPILLLSAIVSVFATFSFQLNFGLANVLFLMWTIAYLAIMERVIPYEPKWHPTLREWTRDGIYLLITMVGGGMAVAAVFYIVSFVSPLHSSLPLWLEVLIALVLSSFGSYIVHRVSHVQLLLWRVHGIHHVEEKVNVGNNGVNHVLDVFCRRILAQLPLVLLGFSQPTLFVIGIFNTVQGYFVHANVDVKLGWINYLLVSPEQHRLHHSKDLCEAGHFSADIPLWDLLLGSYTWRPGRVPQVIGVVNPKKFPPPDAIWASFLNPFRRQAKRKIKAVQIDQISADSRES